MLEILIVLIKFTQCMFPENFVGDIKTPLFILNSVFDSYQVISFLNKYMEKNYNKKFKYIILFFQLYSNVEPPVDDVNWMYCLCNITTCKQDELQYLKGNEIFHMHIVT